MAKSLVVLRTGDKSLHPNWIAEPKEWDFAISYYGTDASKTFYEADYVHRYVGGKWDGIYSFFLAYPRLLEQYDYFWFPDDDILANSTVINQLFARTAELDLELTQPALSRDSYFSHLTTVECGCFSFRHTTMIEIMVPLLRRSLLIKVLPYFEYTRSGFGLDFIWHRLTSDPKLKVVIFDDLTVIHTRPVGASSQGHSRDAELRAFVEQWKTIQQRPTTLGGKLRNGYLIRSRVGCAIFQFICLFWGSWSLKWNGRDNAGGMRRIYWLIRACAKQLRGEPDLSAPRRPNPLTVGSNES